jgi:hypothetical protein
MRNAKRAPQERVAPKAPPTEASPATNYQTGGNAPLYRRVVEKLATNWQPLLGPLTQRKDTPLHKAAAWLTPRVAQFLLPLAERAEASLQPRRFRGWDRVRPKEILVRPPFQEVQELDGVELEVVQGEVPRGLKGHIFWQSFAQEVLHELRFMSRPILMRLDVEERQGAPVKLKLTSRKIVTPSQVFKKAAEATRDRFVFLRALLWISPTAGYQGDYGTGIVAVDDGLLLTANTTSPVLVDKKTLEFVSHFGSKDDYYPAVPFAAPFPPRYMSAHAFYDEHTQEFFSVNYGYGFTRLVVWKPGWDKMHSYLLVDDNDRPLHMRQSAHQLMVCRDYVIVFNNDGHLLDYPNPFAQDGMVFLVPRRGLTGEGGRVKSKKVEIPMTASHEIADYDSTDDIVTFYTAGTVAFAPDMSGIAPNDVAMNSGEYFSDMYWGTFPLSQSDMGHMGRYKIDAKNGKLIEYRRVQDPNLTWDAQYAHTKWGMGIRAHKDAPAKFDKFYATFFGFHKDSVIKRMNDIFRTTKYTVFKWEDLPDQPVPAAIVAADCKNWEIVDHFSFDPFDQPGHCCTIPAADGRRYFVCPVQNAQSDRFFIFDPDRLSAGPICILKSPVQLPYVQHPTWVESLETKRVNYTVDMQKDLVVEGMMASAEKLVREHVIPYFKNN